MRLVVNYGLVIASILAVFAVVVLFPSIVDISSANGASKDWLEVIAGLIVFLIAVCGGSLLYLKSGGR